MNLDDFEALSFDCYGTLVDWETGIVRALRSVFAQSAAAWSDDQLLTSYGRHEAAVEAAAGSHLAYRAVLGEVTAALASDLGVELTGSELGVLARSLPNWPVFDDTGATPSSQARADLEVPDLRTLVRLAGL